MWGGGVEDDGEPFEGEDPALVAELEAHKPESRSWSKAIRANPEGAGLWAGKWGRI